MSLSAAAMTAWSPTDEDGPLEQDGMAGDGVSNASYAWTSKRQVGVHGFARPHHQTWIVDAKQRHQAAGRSATVGATRR